MAGHAFELAYEPEIKGLYVYEAGGGAFSSSAFILLPVLVLAMTKYQCSLNDEWIEWRMVRKGGDKCGADGMGTAYPRDSLDACEPLPPKAKLYVRPPDYDEKCNWFPVNTKLKSVGLDYTSVLNYATALVLLIVCCALLVWGPFGDYEVSKRKLLIITVCLWFPAITLIGPISDPELWPLVGLLMTIAAIGFTWGVKSPLHAYAPIIAHNHHSMKEFDDAHPEGSVRDGGKGEGAAESGVGVGSVHIDRIKLFETLSARVALGSNAMFLGGQLAALVIQAGIVVALAPDERDPRDTAGLRIASVLGAVMALGCSIAGLRYLKPRAGPSFPPGTRLLVGVRRAKHTVGILREKLPELLRVMCGRMFFWIAVQTFVQTAPLFLEREFASPPGEVLVLLIFFFVTGAPVTWFASKVIKRYPGNTHRMACWSSVALCLFPVYYLAALRERFEVIIFVLICGVLIAPWAAFIRTLMTEMIPVNYAATVMSLEGVFEFGSTWVGQVVVGVVLNATDSIRWGIFCLLFFQLAALPFLFRLDMEAGHRQRRAFEEEEMAELRQGGQAAL